MFVLTPRTLSLFVAFSAIVIPVHIRAPHPAARRAAAAMANDNTVAAGKYTNGTLTLDLEAREATWHVEGVNGPAISLFAFAETGKPAQTPGPMIRVNAGTEMRVTVHNTLPRMLRLRGLQDHASASLDTIDLQPGTTRELRFRVDIPGTYMYWGRTEGNLNGAIGSGHDSQLVGAFIVDPVGVKPPKAERVLMITFFEDTVAALGLKPDKAFQLLERFAVARDQWVTFAVNGLSWPHTERLTYTVGDTVRWRVINAGLLTHPMHLHGFYYDVLSRGDAVRDTLYASGERRKVVTEPMATRSTMTVRWVPTRAGNWLFHCHLVDHIDEGLRFGKAPAANAMGHVNHAEQQMAGLVTGIHVNPAPGVTMAGDPVARRRLRVFVDERPNVYRDRPGYSFVLQEGPTPPASDSVRVPSSTIVLHRNEPTEITVINRSHAFASIHWHGIELESFYDGVGDWSGYGTRTASPIAPGDSFVVRMTPDRVGTFIYHTHSDETDQLPSGLYGALLVLAENAQPDTTQRILLMGAGGPQADAPAFLNGSATPPPLELRAGYAHRLRFINISPTDEKRVRIVGDSAVTWRAVAKDGADLPPQQATVRPATVLLLPGETYDFDLRSRTAQVLRLEIVSGGVAGPLMKVPVIVR